MHGMHSVQAHARTLTVLAVICATCPRAILRTNRAAFASLRCAYQSRWEWKAAILSLLRDTSATTRYVCCLFFVVDYCCTVDRVDLLIDTEYES